MTVESFAVLFSALGIVLGHVQVTQPAGLAWYCTVRQDSVSFNLIEDASAPFLFPSTVLINNYVSMYNTVLCIQEKVQGHTAQCTPLYTVHTAVDDVTESTLF